MKNFNENIEDIGKLAQGYRPKVYYNPGTDTIDCLSCGYKWQAKHQKNGRVILEDCPYCSR